MKLIPLILGNRDLTPFIQGDLKILRILKEQSLLVVQELIGKIRKVAFPFKFARQKRRGRKGIERKERRGGEENRERRGYGFVIQDLIGKFFPHSPSPVCVTLSSCSPLHFSW